jgi:hypothetical protein
MKKLIALSLVLGVLVAAGCAEERVNRKTPAKAECADIAGYWLRVGMGDKADLMSITDSCANAEIRENHNSGSIFEGRIGEISKAGNNFKLQHSEENARDMAADYMIVQPAADETAKLAAVEKETLRIKNEMKFHLEATVTDGKRQLLKVLEGKEGNPETNGVLRFNLITAEEAKKLQDELRAKVKKPEAPKVEAPKVEAPKAEAPKAEAPKAEAPKAEAPKAEAPKAEAPKAEAPKAEAPKAEAPKAEAPVAQTLIFDGTIGDSILTQGVTVQMIVTIDGTSFKAESPSATDEESVVEIQGQIGAANDGSRLITVTSISLKKGISFDTTGSILTLSQDGKITGSIQTTDSSARNLTVDLSQSSDISGAVKAAADAAKAISDAAKNAIRLP